MSMKTTGDVNLGIVAGDVLALRGTGLATTETWALLCQAAQALQDLFLSNGGVVDGSKSGPVVTPHTLELTVRGRVILLQAPPNTARAYLPPEYRPGRLYSDTDSEKMWMYTLGRALLDTTPQITALTGTVSVSPTSALQSVLAAMTEPDPCRRASLMNLLDVISEYCKTRLQSRPFTHIIMDMYREVMQSSQYAARKCTVLQPFEVHLNVLNQQNHPQGLNPFLTYENPPQILQKIFQQQTKHRGKGLIFQAQLRNSRSQPNLLNILNSDDRYASCISTRNSSYGNIVDKHSLHQHVRTNSQPECCVERGTSRTIPQGKSNSNLPVIASARVSHTQNINNLLYEEPIYAVPVKPFLSSQDVSTVNTTTRHFQQSQDQMALQTVLIGCSLCGNNDAQSNRSYPDNNFCSQHVSSVNIQRQHSNPQFSSTRDNHKQKLSEFTNSLSNSCNNIIRTHSVSSNIDTWQLQQKQQKFKEAEQKKNSEGKSLYVSRGPPPPKPPRIIAALKKTGGIQAALDVQVKTSAKMQRDLKKGSRARKTRAVQRAPSRLYRTVSNLTQSSNKTCVGPEFVIRANQPVKLLTVGDFKMTNVGRLTVILLTGQRIEVSCDPQKITAGELFQAIIETESIEENFTLGLAVLLAGDFAILPSDTKLNKVAPSGWLNSSKNKNFLGLPTSFMLYLRLRFFLPSLQGIKGWISKHLLYLQIRRCILEQQLMCTLSQLISLTGLALQAEFGNYSIIEHGCGDYFLLEHYVPESLILNSEEQQYRHPQLPDSGNALRKRLQKAHQERRGLDVNKAEEMFVIHAQSLPDYGAHYYIATVNTKELGKLINRQKNCINQNQQNIENQCQQVLYDESDNIYDIENFLDYRIYGKINFHNHITQEHNLERSPYTDEQKIMLSKSSANITHEMYSTPKKCLKIQNNFNNKSTSKSNKFKKHDSDVWLAIHSQGLKIFERGARLRGRLELAKFHWKEIQTLCYGKNYLIVYSRINGKRYKFKLKMDNRKSYYAFKLTSLHHQFFLKFRSELTNLQDLAKDFGVTLRSEPNLPVLKTKLDSDKTKISVADSVKNHQERIKLSKCRTHLEEEQNKENENPLKYSEHKIFLNKQIVNHSINTAENNVLYAQINSCLEPQEELHDTKNESDCKLIMNSKTIFLPKSNLLQVHKHITSDGLYNYANSGIPNAKKEKEYVYTIPKSFSADGFQQLNEKIKKYKDFYTTNDKLSLFKKINFPTSITEECKDLKIQKALDKIKVEILPKSGTNEQNENYDSSNMPCNLHAKLDSEIPHTGLIEHNTNPIHNLETSINSISAKSIESPIPEAYVLNADIRTCEETFRIPDETMSTSLMAKLDELSFDEERMLRTIKLERGQGGSIGLQVTEGTDGGVYVQAVSVGGSADMTGNVHKGDRIVAINGQSLLNFGYEDALKMLQNSSKTIELVLSQIVLINNDGDQIQEPTDNNYLQNIRFNVSSEAESSDVMSSKWLKKTLDVISMQNTSSAYSSAASSIMGNHNVNTPCISDVDQIRAINSASILLSLEDFDISCSNTQQVFI